MATLTQDQEQAVTEWYATRTLGQLKRELASAREALKLAQPHRETDFRARVVCEANEQAIPRLEALIRERVAWEARHTAR